MQNILEYARLKEIKECDCYEKENHFIIEPINGSFFIAN